ncbi:MAG: hypothetical protein M3527_08415, partial [Actinomycetota bacterium]|nr:hypothetical protein [Actinomycetota bacterium]
MRIRRAAVALAALAVLVPAVLPTPALGVPEDPPYPSIEWTVRELANYARTLEAPTEQAADPRFLARLLEQSATNTLESLAFPTDSTGNLCETWGLSCAGDPFRYPGVDPFYDEVGEVVPVLFPDRQCARLSGRVWAPRDRSPGQRFPGVVIENGSIQAPETLYWFFAQALVRSGYVVLTFDVRGQGRSDNHTPAGEQGSNANPSVFWTGLVDAVDFLRSTPAVPYPPSATCPAGGATLAPSNPLGDALDAERIGLAGHSLGATGVTVVQSY